MLTHTQASIHSYLIHYCRRRVNINIPAVPTFCCCFVFNLPFQRFVFILLLDSTASNGANNFNLGLCKVSQNSNVDTN